VNSTEAHRSVNAVYLCVVPVRVNYGSKQLLTYAFLNPNSTHSFCNQTLVNALGISGTEEELILNTLTGSKSHRGCTFSLYVSSLTEVDVYYLPNVVSIEDILVSPNAIPTVKNLKRFLHLRGLDFP